MASLDQNFEEEIQSRKGGGNIMSGDSWEERTYVGRFTDTTANSIDARNGTGVPAFGAALGSYSLYVLEKQAEPDPGNQRVWRVRITYRTLNANMQQPYFNSASSTHIWQVIKSISPYPVEIPVQKDRSGKVMVNCIGEPIKPSPTMVIYDEQINISFMTDLINRTQIDACKGKVNDSAIVLTIGGATASYAANTLLFSAPPIEEVYDQDGNKVAKVVYQLLYRKDTFTGLFPNLSFNYYGGSGTLGSGGTTNKPIVIGTGTSAAYVTEAQYLSLAGSVLGFGMSITICNSGNGYDYLSTASFTTLLSGLTS